MANPDSAVIPQVDIVTVVHNERNTAQAGELFQSVLRHANGVEYSWTVIDNSVENRGFGRACNLGAWAGNAPVIGFLNPDVTVHGTFLEQAIDTLRIDKVVITGCRFEKDHHELRLWGVRDWVCGAAFFVRRHFFESVHGFDESFVWGWEETDLIRQAEAAGYQVRSIVLPIAHQSPLVESARDVNYKRYHFDRGARRFYEKWGKA